MWILRNILAVALGLTCYSVQAQGTATERTATREEIYGAWRLVPLPASFQPKLFKQNPWPAECQWFFFSPKGALKTIEKANGPCEEKSTAELARAFNQDEDPGLTWDYEPVQASVKALLVIKLRELKDAEELWIPHYVTKKFASGGAEFDEGDLLLYFVHVRTRQFAWVRHLRPVR